MPFPLGAALGAGSAIAGAIGGIFQNKSNRDFSREQYQRQHDDNLAHWHRQNDYNSPKNQAERLEQAGLNKSLLYGQGAGSGGNAGSLPSSANQQAVNQVDPIAQGLTYLSAFQDLKIKQAQTSNIQRDTCLLYTSPSPRDQRGSRMPSSA